jgi:hypothetical protein
MKKILEMDPSNDQAGKSIRRLEPLAAVKREKMKEEMIGKTFCLSHCFLNIFIFFGGWCVAVVILRFLFPTLLNVCFLALHCLMP